MRVALLSRARRAALLGPLVLGVNGDDLARQHPGCDVQGSELLVYRGSALFVAGAAQLGLSRGRAEACASPLGSAVLTALDAALGSFPGQRLREPLRVHVDPRVPRGEAPVTGIEVHATSREILVGADALAQLPAEAWTHELLHALAPPPPVASPLGRRLWLTLEEGLVAYLTAALGPTQSELVAAAEAWPLSAGWEELTLAEYDPHRLADGLRIELAHALSESPPSARLELLDCLTAEPAPLPDGTERLRDVVRSFTARCAAQASRRLESAVQRWLPEPLSPLPARVASVASAAGKETR